MKYIYKHKITGYYLSWDKFFHYENDIWKKEDAIDIKDAEIFNERYSMKSIDEYYNKIYYNDELKRLRKIKLDRLKTDY